MIKTRIDLLFGFDTIIKFYPYRTAYVAGVCIENDENNNLYKEVKSFVEGEGYKMDNHICFTTNEGVNFMWTDNTLIVGYLNERNWSNLIINQLKACRLLLCGTFKFNFINRN